MRFFQDHDSLALLSRSGARTPPPASANDHKSEPFRGSNENRVSVVAEHKISGASCAPLCAFVHRLLRRRNANAAIDTGNECNFSFKLTHVRSFESIVWSSSLFTVLLALPLLGNRCSIRSVWPTGLAHPSSEVDLEGIDQRRECICSEFLPNRHGWATENSMMASSPWKAVTRTMTESLPLTP